MDALAKALPYVVDCKPGKQAFYERIAGFNAERIALAYARDCKAQNPGNEYKVVNLSEHAPYVTVTQLGSGYAAILLHWAEGGFYEPWQTGEGRYATREEAEPEARSMAESEGVEFRE